MTDRFEVHTRKAGVYADGEDFEYFVVDTGSKPYKAEGPCDGRRTAERRAAELNKAAKTHEVYWVNDWTGFGIVGPNV
jgi:hypothetical protein